jgi:hypothetical protein
LIPVNDRGQDLSGDGRGARPLLFCFPAGVAGGASLEDHPTPMFVVMQRAASEAEILGVKSRILAEGLTPYENPSAEGL